MDHLRRDCRDDLRPWTRAEDYDAGLAWPGYQSARIPVAFHSHDQWLPLGHEVQVPSVSIHEADTAREVGWGPFDPYARTPLALHHRLIVDGRLYALCTYFRGVQLDPSEPAEVSLEARVVVRPVEAPPPPPDVRTEPEAASSSGLVRDFSVSSVVRPFASHSFDSLLPVRPSSAVGGEPAGGEAGGGEAATQLRGEASADLAPPLASAAPEPEASTTQKRQRGGKRHRKPRGARGKGRGASPGS